MSGTRVSRHLKRFTEMSLEDEIRASISILTFTITFGLTKNTFPHVVIGMVVMFSTSVMLIPFYYFFVLDSMDPHRLPGFTQR